MFDDRRMDKQRFYPRFDGRCRECIAISDLFSASAVCGKAKSKKRLLPNFKLEVRTSFKLS